jgi:uncharacterized membrane protein
MQCLMRQWTVSGAIVDAHLLTLSPASKDEPAEPGLLTTKINTVAVLLTVRLAIFYFRKQFNEDKTGSSDQLLVLGDSVAGYLDLPVASVHTYIYYH